VAEIVGLPVRESCDREGQSPKCCFEIAEAE
jgi:hypothetical protein